jgi:hypothetical protein
MLVYDPDTGLLKDANSLPTVAVRKNGDGVGDAVTVSKRAATSGIYDCEHNPAGEVEKDIFTMQESVNVNGVSSSGTYNYVWSYTVIASERGTDNALTSIDLTTSTQDVRAI